MLEPRNNPSDLQPTGDFSAADAGIEAFEAFAKSQDVRLDDDQPVLLIELSSDGTWAISCTHDFVVADWESRDPQRMDPGTHYAKTDPTRASEVKFRVGGVMVGLKLPPVDPPGSSSPAEGTTIPRDAPAKSYYAETSGT